MLIPPRRQESGKSFISVWNAKQTNKNTKHGFPTALRAGAVSPPSQRLPPLQGIMLQSFTFVSTFARLCKSEVNLACVEVGKNILGGETLSIVSQYFDAVTEFKDLNWKGYQRCPWQPMVITCATLIISLFFSALVIELRPACILGKRFTTDLNLQASGLCLFICLCFVFVLGSH